MVLYWFSFSKEVFRYCAIFCIFVSLSKAKTKMSVPIRLNVFLLHLPWWWVKWVKVEGGGLVPATVPQVWTINPQDGAIPGASNLDLGEGTQFLPPPISLFSPKLISTQSTIPPISDFWSKKHLNLGCRVKLQFGLEWGQVVQICILTVVCCK